MHDKPKSTAPLKHEPSTQAVVPPTDPSPKHPPVVPPTDAPSTHPPVVPPPHPPVVSPNSIVCTGSTCPVGGSYLTCPKQCKQRVGMFYTGWHLPAYHAIDLLRQHNDLVLSIEDLLRSRLDDGSSKANTYQFEDLLLKPGVVNTASSFYYQHFPQQGPYCIVHQRKPGDLNYNPAHEGNYGYLVEDCPNYKDILRKHAQQMVDAGIDFIIMDASNAQGYSAFSDAIQLRPFEVVVQEWSALRAEGILTPEVAIFQRFPILPASPNEDANWLYSKMLSVYNTQNHENVIMRDAKTSKMIYFYYDMHNFDPNFIETVNDNGGKNNIISVPMSAYLQTPEQWSFLSACQQNAEIDDRPCDQGVTPNSLLGTQIAVSPSYQLTYASVAFQASGVYGGLVLRKQFETAFNKRPDYLLLSQWNGTIAQPKHAGPSMGLESDPTAKGRTFVDDYGVAFSRDLEPSDTYGTMLYDIMRSCLKLYHRGAQSCSDRNELCCQGGNFSDTYARYKGSQGEFVLYAPGIKANANQQSLWSCLSHNNSFFSLDKKCEGKTQKNLLGYVSKVKGGETLRALWRCYQRKNSSYAYTLNTICPSNFVFDKFLGYVR